MLDECAIRDKLIKVIVRQALAGAPWRELCGPVMQINGIDEKEIEEEIRRNGGENSSPSRIPVQPYPPDGSGSMALPLPMRERNDDDDDEFNTL